MQLMKELARAMKATVLTPLAQKVGQCDGFSSFYRHG